MIDFINAEVEDDIDKMINKLKELKALRIEAAQIAAEDTYLTTEDVAKRLGVSEQAAREYMSRPGFPLLEVGKGYKVSAIAFALYNLERHLKGSK